MPSQPVLPMRYEFVKKTNAAIKKSHALQFGKARFFVQKHDLHATQRAEVMGSFFQGLP